jgi:hypothetical protein
LLKYVVKIQDVVRYSALENIRSHTLQRSKTDDSLLLVKRRKVLIQKLLNMYKRLSKICPVVSLNPSKIEGE